MRFASSIVSLHQITAGRAEEEGVEKVSHKRDFCRPSEGQIETLHLHPQPPSHYTDEGRKPHKYEGEEHGAGTDQGQLFPEARRAVAPAKAPLFESRQLQPCVRRLMKK